MTNQVTKNKGLGELKGEYSIHALSQVCLLIITMLDVCQLYNSIKYMLKFHTCSSVAVIIYKLWIIIMMLFVTYMTVHVYKSYFDILVVCFIFLLHNLASCSNCIMVMPKRYYI